MSGSIYDTSIFDLSLAHGPSTYFAPANHAPLKSKKTLPFPLPDPYADDATFELYDPRGLFNKSRRGSSAHSRAGTAGSDDSGSVGAHSRESSAGAESRFGGGLTMTSLADFGERGRSDTAGSDRVPSLSPSLKDEPMVLDHTPTPRTPSNPIAIDPVPSPYPANSAIDTADLLASPRGRNPLHRLRIGSAGADPAPSPTFISPQHRVDESPGRLPFATGSSDSRSRESSTSDGLQPWSPAASFLSSFSPDQGRGIGFGASLEGDQAGFGVAGYVLGRELGAGGFGIVREATRVGDGQRLAVKIVRHGVEPPAAQTAGDELRRSVSQLKASASSNGASRRLTIATDRSRSASSPTAANVASARVPIVAGPRTMARTISSQMRDLSASLSSLPPPSHPAAETEPSLVQDLLKREISLWQQLAPHPHIMPLLDVHHTPDFSYIFMPLCEGGNLLSYLNDYERARRAGASPSKRKPRGRTSIPIAPISPTPLSDQQASQNVRRGLPLPICLAIFAQVVQGLHYLHTEAHVTHKDIKLENILCDEPGGTWRIADFGLAEAATPAPAGSTTSRRRPKGGGGDEDADMTDTDDATTGAHFISASDRGPVTPGTPLASLSRAGSLSRTDSAQSLEAHLHPAGSLPYSSPEQMSSPVPLLDPSVDIWALGCVLYALVDGSLPFVDEFEPRLRMKIMKGAWEVPASLAPGEDDRGDKALVLDVLRHCLEPDPALRWTIDDVRNSEWLSGEKARGRSGTRPGARRTGSSFASSPSSRSPSVGGAPRRKERSTSRGPIQHYAVDPRTRERERGKAEKDERKMRWDRERGDGRSASRGKAPAVVEERLGRCAEPY